MQTPQASRSNQPLRDAQGPPASLGSFARRLFPAKIPPPPRRRARILRQRHFPVWSGLSLLLGLVTASSAPIKEARSSVEPVVIKKIYFMIHPFCYRVPRPAGYPDTPEGRGRWDQYVAYEKETSQRWFQKIAAMGPKDALVVCAARVGCPKDLREFAEAHLGPRAVVIEDYLDAPGSDLREQLSPKAKMELGEELLAMFWRYGSGWTAQSSYLTVVARGWTARCQQIFQQRGLTFDPKTVRAEGWGESFEGCVANYCRYLGTYFELANSVEDDFGMTVPDAPFLLTAKFLERVPLAHDVRLYLWAAADGQLVALFQNAKATVGAPALYAQFPLRGLNIEIRNKRNSQLWPGNIPPANGSVAEALNRKGKTFSTWDQRRRENESACVEHDGALKVPIPILETDLSYIIAHGTTLTDLRAVLANARIVEEPTFKAPD